MKNKFLFLSTIISACALSFSINAADRNSNFPQGGHKCNQGNGKCPNKIESVNPNYPYQQQQQPQAAKKLKTDSVEKFKGTVKTVNRERYPDGKLFIQVILETNEGDKTILVGPASYVDQSKVKLQAGDQVTVSGFRVGANGDEVIMAKEIDKSGNILKLLNDQRQPLWGNGNSYQGNGNSYQGNGSGYMYNSSNGHRFNR